MPRQVFGPRAWAEFLPLAAAYHALRRLPLDTAIRLGATLGALAASLDRINRPVALRNLEIAFPESDFQYRLKIFRSSYRNWGRVAAEWCHIEDFNAHNIRQFVSIEGFENLLRAKEISRSSGIVLVSGHFGNFELLQVAAALYGFPVTLIHRPLRNPIIDRMVNRARLRYGNRSLPRRGAGLSALRLLKQGGLVGVAADLDVRRGVFVNFFSLPASTTESPARLALASGAPLLPVFIVREARHAKHRIVIFPAIPVVTNGGSGKDTVVREATQRFTSVFEEMIRRYPDHWNWIHRRWKTRPNGEARFY